MAPKKRACSLSDEDAAEASASSAGNGTAELLHSGSHHPVPDDKSNVLVDSAIMNLIPASAAGNIETCTPPMSPQSNRDKFIALSSPIKMNCALSTLGMTNPNARFDFQAVVLVVYPACQNPARRHVSLVDASGATGITVWSNHVTMFDVSSVGQVVKFTNLTISTHNGKRSLAMARDSAIKFLVEPELSRAIEKKWWVGLLDSPPLSISNARDMNDDMIVSVSGILFMVHTETKKVRDELKDLVTVRLADSTGHMDVRTWNHDSEYFRSFLEKPVLVQRVRITSFAGTKVAEMLDGAGTTLSSNFAGSVDLAKFWKAPANDADQ